MAKVPSHLAPNHHTDIAALANSSNSLLRHAEPQRDREADHRARHKRAPHPISSWRGRGQATRGSTPARRQVSSNSCALGVQFAYKNLGEITGHVRMAGPIERHLAAAGAGSACQVGGQCYISFRGSALQLGKAQGRNEAAHVQLSALPVSLPSQRLHDRIPKSKRFSQCSVTAMATPWRRGKPASHPRFELLGRRHAVWHSATHIIPGAQNISTHNCSRSARSPERASDFRQSAPSPAR